MKTVLHPRAVPPGKEQRRMSNKREGQCAGCVQADHMCHYCKRDPRRPDCYDSGYQNDMAAEDLRRREEFFRDGVIE